MAYSNIESLRTVEQYGKPMDSRAHGPFFRREIGMAVILGGDSVSSVVYLCALVVLVNLRDLFGARMVSFIHL